MDSTSSSTLDHSDVMVTDEMTEALGRYRAIVFRILEPELRPGELARVIDAGLDLYRASAAAGAGAWYVAQVEAVSRAMLATDERIHGGAGSPPPWFREEEGLDFEEQRALHDAPVPGPMRA